MKPVYDISQFGIARITGEGLLEAIDLEWLQDQYDFSTPAAEEDRRDLEQTASDAYFQATGVR